MSENSRAAGREAAARRRKRRLRRTITIAVLLALVVVGIIWGVRACTSGAEPAGPAPETPAAELTQEPEPLTPAQELLAATDDPQACVITFEGADAALALQTQGTLYVDLPIPARDGEVFAGWYPTEQEAAAQDPTVRVNGADMVECVEQQRTLYGAWVTPEQFDAADVGVPILMYHQFTDDPAGEGGWLHENYAYVGSFDEQMAYLATEQFYLPTWDELEAFIDGQLILPQRSVIVTDDDADQTWFDLGVPVVDEYGILSTSFMVTQYRQDPAPSPYVLRRSHTHDMHHAGDNGQGMMVNLTPEEIAADLQKSAEVLGVAEVVAYPFGHHDQRSKDGVAAAGFTLARTIEWGYVRPGTDKLALPVIRINYSTSMDEFRGAVG